MHDVLDPRDMVPDEAEHKAHSGFPVGDRWERARRAADENDLPALAEVARELDSLSLRADWAYVEPDDEAELRTLAASAPVIPIVSGTERSRMKGAWLGRTVANTMGKPVEGLSRREVEVYLRAGGDWPQTGFVNLVDPRPEGLWWLHPDAETSTLGSFSDVPRDDDIDWTILGLFMLETYGPAITTEDIAREWLDRLPFTQTFTAERAAYRNLVLGKTIPETATYLNPYREWIGALIRADIFGYVYPGDPASAAVAAITDARLSHVKNGVYGEMWAAALVAAALASEDALAAVVASLAVVPPKSRLYEAVSGVVKLRSDGASFDAALDWIDEHLGHYNWVHTVNNAAILTAGLLWGKTFTDAVAKTIAGGSDTDSNGATAGSIWGALYGEEAIPAELVGTTHIHVRSAVRGFDRITIDELTDRTLILRKQFSKVSA